MSWLVPKYHGSSNRQRERVKTSVSGKSGSWRSAVVGRCDVHRV